MATQEKLQKSLEILKLLSDPNQSSDPSKRKEKVQHCQIVTEAISNPSIKVSSNFPILLSLSIEVFLKLCDDPESDIRMLSEECLNRIIRAVNNINITKVHIELHKEIKRNGAARSLRAALSRFSQLAHLIRPHKGKPFVANLFPSIVKVVERNEEQIHETLANSLPRIMKALGVFMPDNDVKILLKAFFSNICNPSATIRRTTASSILTICLNCKKPSIFLSYTLNSVLDIILPVLESHSTFQILGVLTCLKTLIPHLNFKEDLTNLKISNLSQKEFEFSSISVDRWLQMYELCMHYLNQTDHNILNASLETLNTVLQNAPKVLKTALTNPTGLNKSRIVFSQSSSFSKLRSPSQLSLANNRTVSEENLFSESELTDTLNSDIEKWIDESKLTMMNLTFAKSKDSLDGAVSEGLFNETKVPCEYTFEKCSNFEMASRSLDQLDKLTVSENSSDKNSCTGEEARSESGNAINIGEFLDRGIPLLYCARLICKKFLLTGHPNGLIPDRAVRVSVKSASLMALSSVIHIFPEALTNTLSIVGERARNSGSQLIFDILLYSDHSDPQLRGTVRIIIATFIKTVLIHNGYDYDKWIEEKVQNEGDLFSIKKLMKILAEGLEDESTNSCRQSLQAVGIVFSFLARSLQSQELLNVMSILPSLAKNPYWLVKVDLCELVADLPYMIIHFISGSGDFQRKVFYNVLFEMLKDADLRVRTSAAKSLVLIVPKIFDSNFYGKECTATSKAIEYRKMFLSDLSYEETDNDIYRDYFVKNMQFPFNQLDEKACNKIEFTLSKLVNQLYRYIISSTSKHFIFGCIETLALLSEKYPPTVYIEAWTIYNKDNSDSKLNPDLLNLCIGLFNNSILLYDVAFQINLLKLVSNLYAGQVLHFLRPVQNLEEKKVLWDMFSNSNLVGLSEDFLSHIVKMLNIFHHICNEMVPVQNQAKSGLPNLPSSSSLSPLKRRKSDLDKKILIQAKTSDKEEKSEKRHNAIISFINCSHYMKIYDLLKSSYTNYKISLDSEASQNFLMVLKQILNSLSVLLEIGTLTEFGRIGEDLLGFLRTVFLLDMPTTVQCVQQTLRCLFGANLTANSSEMLQNFKRNNENDDSANDNAGFYYNLAQKPYNELYKCINALNQINKSNFGSDCTVMGYLHRKDMKKSTGVLRCSDKFLANYIMIFEPIVIQSLKQYTITSNSILQSRVLQLLSQLIQLRVNYCLLDSEHIFIEFVIKQFEFIEEGQIPHPEELIPRMFHFLVQLSNNKQHSKSIIEVPKIIQLCDGLMASGQPPMSYCIPALEPFIHNIFLSRNKLNTEDMKELETTREVVFSMLLRLCDYPKVLELIILILEDSRYCSDSPDKWWRWSKQVTDTFLPLFGQNKVKIEDSQSFATIKKFFFTLNPDVLPMDQFIVMLFQDIPLLDSDLKPFNRWISKILILLLVISPLKESVLLLKIQEMKKEFVPSSVFENYKIKADPLNVLSNTDAFQDLSAEFIFIKFLFRVVQAVLDTCFEEESDSKFLIEQFSKFLMHCLHILQSGSHWVIFKTATSIVSQSSETRNDLLNLEKINDRFIELSVEYPSVAFQWCYLLTLLNFRDTSFWSKVMLMKRFEERCPSINMEILKIGGVILYCDYLIENSEHSQLDWMITNNMCLIVKLCDEGPVSEFLDSVHTVPSTSKMVLDAITSSCLSYDDPVFKVKILKCIENCHSSQCGSVLKLLIFKMLLSRQMYIARNVAYLASRKIDLLLTMAMEEVNAQLSKTDLVQIKSFLVDNNLIKKHETLVGLINKLCSTFYEIDPMELDQRRIVNPEYVKKLDINKTWFLNQIECNIGDQGICAETADLLSNLDYPEVFQYLSDSKCNKLLLKHCILLGFEKMKKMNVEEPAILLGSIDCLLKDVAYIKNKIPKPHGVFRCMDRDMTKSEENYSFQLTELFKNEEFSNLLFTLTPCVSAYLETLPNIPLKIPDNSFEDLLKFAVLSLESINYLIDTDKGHLNINLIDSALTCSNLILNENHLCSILALETHTSWLCSAINSIYKLVNFLLINDDPLPSIPKYMLSEALNNLETLAAGKACYQLYILIYWLQSIKSEKVNIPSFLFKHIKGIIITLCRLPMVNSYMLIPERVWKTGWSPVLSGNFLTQVPPLPIDLLQEIDILEEFIYRISLIGWISRLQFEETWMCLLSVLCTPTEKCTPSELTDSVQAISLTIKSISSALLKTLRLPLNGNSYNSKLIHVSRNNKLPENSVNLKKLRLINDAMQFKFKELNRVFKNAELVNVFEQDNFEKIGSGYSYGQISVKYFLIATNILEEGDENCKAWKICKLRQKMLEQSGLDINSCIHFLLDYFSQLMNKETTSHLRILYEAVRASLVISDLFNDKTQFNWLLTTFMDLSKKHPIEDDLIHQYLVIGICKAVSVLTPEIETYEYLKKLIMQNLNSTFLSARIAALYGLLYILEGSKLSNISIGSISDELQLIIPCAVEYIQCNINTKNSIFRKSQEHTALIWSLAFYLIENIEETYMESNFVSNTLQTAFLILQEKNNVIHNSIIKGLERLLIAKTELMSKYKKQILKVALENMKNEKSNVAILGIQLLFSYMYTDCADHFENAEKKPNTPTNPDHLVQTIEKFSAIFERIKRGYNFEVEILCSVLPILLDDFFSPSDILTKVIGEFLSPQQPHPKLLSKMVFQVFESAIQRDQLSLLQDWVVFSLSNFTQSFSIGMSTWCLTCFFISASQNPWLRSSFPYIQGRVGRYEYEDRKMLCIAGVDFYKNLSNDKQKKTFVDNFTKVKDLVDTPFNDLLASL